MNAKFQRSNQKPARFEILKLVLRIYSGFGACFEISWKNFAKKKCCRIAVQNIADLV